MYKLIIAPLIAFLSRLRFPALFAVTAVLFVLDFFIPDVIPYPTRPSLVWAPRCWVA